MTAHIGGIGAAVRAAAALVVALVVVCFASGAFAADRLQLFVTQEQGFARLVLSFPDRLDLPTYRIAYDNGVLAIEFDEEIAATLPDIAVALPGWVTVARVDPDHKGLRLGLRTTLNINHIEAGEKLFVDLLPPTWQGLPPGLPADVVAALAQRSEEASLRVAQRRKAEDAAALHPTVQLRVGRNPTFMRMEFDWSVATEATFNMDTGVAQLDFSWPVPIDLYDLKADLPPQIVSVDETTNADGAHVRLTMAEGAVPRFYQVSPTNFIVDVDIAGGCSVGTVIPDELVEAGAQPAPNLDTTVAMTPPSPATDTPSSVAPYVTVVGGTVRLVFPFEADVAAAVFRRGPSIWMIFDTAAEIETPANLEALTPDSGAFSVIPAGDTRVVRLDLSDERLATLGTEGRAWVLSLGDVLLSPTEPIALNRRHDAVSQFEMTADLGHAGTIHDFRDPVAGDILTVVTAFPPARGVIRQFDFVDFTALPTVHGLVVKPKSDGTAVTLEGSLAVIRGTSGLELSATEQARGMTVGLDPAKRPGYLNLAALDEDDVETYLDREDALLQTAAATEEDARDVPRLKLAQYYVANRFAEEALGVLDVLEADLKNDRLRQTIGLTRAIADVIAERPGDALGILSQPAYAEDADATMWRAIARSQSGDFAGARLDAMASEIVIESYPLWVRRMFLFGAARAAIESGDLHLGRRYLGLIEPVGLEPEQASLYQLLDGRAAEAEGKDDDALLAYGRVIADDIRPTRAEAVYRTLLILDRTGKIDLAKATETLAAESMLWRGDDLEAGMQQLLARLYFEHGDYRLGFETVKQALQEDHGETATRDALAEEAKSVFTDLFLNGTADALDPVQALALFYDFRDLTPPGSRGDEMIRNLARRLVALDLLKQAGDLLEYQIDTRLDGAAKAQIGAELAVIRIADRDPQGALKVLNRSRLANLPPTLERQRRVLEAKALLDSGREELAIDLLSSLMGRDAELLRIDALWKGDHYAAASELIEVTYGGDAADMLNQSARLNIVKAAVGFVLANDRLGLSRLRSKFADRMAATPEWPMFDFVTGPIESTQSSDFRQIAHDVAGIDGLNAFLESYRTVYGPDELAPTEATVPAAATL